MHSEEELPRELGSFTLERRLGAGAFGTVYQAFHRAENRRVALKLLHVEGTLDEETRLRFRREAQAAAKVAHANCVFVYGVHELEGVPAIEMELLTGGTLQQRIDSGEPLPLTQVMSLALQLLDGIDAVHRAGLLHRDIKPSNCFLGENGQLKVGDFGLSLMLKENLRLTATGRFLGTPLFAPPEQIRGEAIDRRADVYSAAATIYQMLAGHPPFVARTYEECIAMVLTQDPVPLAASRADVPPEVGTVLLRALAKEPKRRPASAAALRDALDALQPARSAPGPLLPRAIAGALDWLVAFLAALLIAEELPGIAPWITGGATVYEVPTIGIPLVLFAYHAIALLLFSASPGQMLVGLRVRSASGRLSPGRLSLRVLAYPVLPLGCYMTAYWAGRFAGFDIEQGALSWSIGLPLSLAMVGSPLASWRPRMPFVAWHERWSGTRTVVRPLASAARYFQPRAAAVEPAPEGVGTGLPFAIKGMIGRTHAGLLLLAYDAQLGRDVWIHTGDAELPLDPGAARDPAALRLVASYRQASTHVVYECPGGASLGAYEADRSGVPWSAARQLLLRLCEALQRSSVPLQFDRLWVDANGNLRVLDFHLLPKAGGAAADSGTQFDLLGRAAQCLLGCEHSDGRFKPPPTLPLHADGMVSALVRRNPGFRSLAEAQSALAASMSRPTSISGRSRRRQLISGLLAPILCLFLAAPWHRTTVGQILAWTERDQQEVEAPGAMSSGQQRETRWRLPEGIRADIRKVIAFEASNGSLVPEWWDDETAAVAAAAIGAYPAIDLSEYSHALDRLSSEFELTKAASQAGHAKWENLVHLLAFGAGISCVLAFVLRLQPSWGLVGVRFRGPGAAPVSRMRIAWRTALSWAPWLLVAVTGAMMTASSGLGHAAGDGVSCLGRLALILVRVLPKAVAGISLVGVALHRQFRQLLRAFGLWRGEAGVVVADDERGIIDRLAGTHPVAR